MNKFIKNIILIFFAMSLLVFLISFHNIAFAEEDLVGGVIRSYSHQTTDAIESKSEAETIFDNNKNAGNNILKTYSSIYCLKQGVDFIDDNESNWEVRTEDDLTSKVETHAHKYLNTNVFAYAAAFSIVNTHLKELKKRFGV